MKYAIPFLSFFRHVRPFSRSLTHFIPVPLSLQWRNNGVGRVGKVQGAPECKGPPSSKQKIIIITVKCRHNYSQHRMFRCSIAAANTDKLQFKFKFYSYVMRNCVDDKNDNNAQKGGPHLNICLGAPDSLVTPLYLSPVLHPLASRGTAVAPTG